MLQIQSHDYGSRKNEEFSIASSTASPYTPIRDYPAVEYIDNMNYTYYKPLITVRHSTLLSTYYLSQYLNYYLDFEKFQLSKTNETIIYVSKGCIFDSEMNILLMLSYKAGSSVYFTRYNEPTKENAKNLTLFLSTELLMNPVYTMFYKKLDKEYIRKAFEIELPVVFIASDEIERLHYSNEFKVEFNQISNFESHLKNDVGRIFNMTDVEFEYFNPGLGREIQEGSPIPEEEEISYVEYVNRGAQMLEEAFRESHVQQILTGTNSFTINTDGNVGINSGIVTPSTPLHISSTTSNIGYSIGVDPYLSVNGSISTLQTDASGLVINHEQEVVESYVVVESNDFEFIDDTEQPTNLPF